jgi:hypothetical protein
MIGPTDLLHPSPAPNFKTFQVTANIDIVKEKNILASAENRTRFPRGLYLILVTTLHRHCISAYIVIIGIRAIIFFKLINL